MRVTLANMPNNESVTFVGLGVGFHPLVVKRVWATGTTASNILALY